MDGAVGCWGSGDGRRTRVRRKRREEVIAEFFKRNDQSTLVLPPKVSDLLAQGKKV